jgi:hypothetical protein
MKLDPAATINGVVQDLHNRRTLGTWLKSLNRDSKLTHADLIDLRDNLKAQVRERERMVWPRACTIIDTAFQPLAEKLQPRNVSVAAAPAGSIAAAAAASRHAATKVARRSRPQLARA